MSDKPVKLSADLTVDLPTLIDTRLLIQANSGGGKSFCVRRLLEQTHDKVQHLVIDLEGEFGSLREKFDYVLAGKDGDTAADPRTAALLAERLLELKVSAILDIYELRHHERILFVKAFLTALVNAKKALWHPVLVVVDEAHVFCPQQGEAESAPAVIDLCTRGRKRGFCAVLATQRLSKLHKDAAAECNNVLIGRSSLDLDTKRAADVLGFSGKEQQQVLRRLDPGEFFAYGPALSREVHRVTIGAVTTTHPKAGGGRIAFTAPPPTAKVRAVLAKLADLPAEVEQRARTEAELRAELAALKRQMATERPQAAPAVTKRVEVPVLKAKQIARLEACLRAVQGIEERFHAIVGKAETAMFDIHTAIGRVEDYHRVADAKPAPETRTVAPRAPVPFRLPPASASNAHLLMPTLPPGERAILIAAAQHSEGITREQAAVLSGYRKSTRNIYIQRLATKGLLYLENGLIHATEQGRAALGSAYEPLPTGHELQAYWLSKLPVGEAAVLRAAIAQYPEATTREDIDVHTGFKKSTRNIYLQRLKARNLITTDHGRILASGTLFG